MPIIVFSIPILLICDSMHSRDNNEFCIEVFQYYAKTFSKINNNHDNNHP